MVALPLYQILQSVPDELGIQNLLNLPLIFSFNFHRWRWWDYLSFEWVIGG